MDRAPECRGEASSSRVADAVPSRACRGSLSPARREPGPRDRGQPQAVLGTTQTSPRKKKSPKLSPERVSLLGPAPAQGLGPGAGADARVCLVQREFRAVRPGGNPFPSTACARCPGPWGKTRHCATEAAGAVAALETHPESQRPLGSWRGGQLSRHLPVAAGASASWPLGWVVQAHLASAGVRHSAPVDRLHVRQTAGRVPRGRFSQTRYSSPAGKVLIAQQGT